MHPPPNSLNEAKQSKHFAAKFYKMKIKFNIVKTSSLLNSKQAPFDWKMIHDLLTNGNTHVQAPKGVGFDPVGSTSLLFKGEILTANSEKNRSHSSGDRLKHLHDAIFDLCR